MRSREGSSVSVAPPAVRQRSPRIVSFASVLLLTAAIYALPWMTASGGNRSGLPPTFGADSYAYLNLSHVFTISGIPDHDPWYGVPIQPKFGHSTFRAAFVLFRATRSVLGNDVTTSVVWSISWSAFIAAGLWLLLRSLFDEASVLFLFAGTCMMAFFSLSTLKINLLDWFHLLSGSIRNDLPLPFVRMFFPQIAIPLLAFYFICCKKAWDHGRMRDFVGMVAIQIGIFLSFPYGSVLMALATVMFLVLMAAENNWRKRVLQFGMMGTATLLADALYLWLALRPTSAGRGQHGTPLFHLDFSQLRTDFGGTVVLILVLATFLFVMQRKNASRVLIVSIGAANALMLLADCVIDPRLMVSHHAGYFVQLSLGLELCGVCYWAKDFVSHRFLKIATATASVFFVYNGALASWASVRANDDANTRDASFAQVITQLQLTSEDLVIAAARDVDDISTAVPLLSRAKVLYTPEAEILLGPGDERLMNQRHAAYLYLSGRDSSWVEAQLSNHVIPPTVLTLGQRFELQYHRREDLMEEEVRQNLLPELHAFDLGGNSAVLAGSRRVIILDDINHPTFDDSHVHRLLTVFSDYNVGPVRVRLCSAAQSGQSSVTAPGESRPVR